MAQQSRPRGPRYTHAEYRQIWRQSSEVTRLVLEFAGVSETAARRKTRLGNSIRRLIFLTHLELGLPVRWHSSKPGPGFKWQGDVNLADDHLRLTDYRKVLDTVVLHVRDRLDLPLDELPFRLR